MRRGEKTEREDQARRKARGRRRESMEQGKGREEKGKHGIHTLRPEGGGAVSHDWSMSHRML